MFLLLLGGCSVTENAQTLNGFCERMNEAYQYDTFSPIGFIFNENDSTYTRYYTFDACEVLLQFVVNEKARITRMDLSATNLCSNDEGFHTFLKSAVLAFSPDRQNTERLTEQIDFDNLLQNTTLKTVEYKSGDICLSADITAPGTVISVYYYDS